MGHIVGKDVYQKLGRKIDCLTTRAPWNDHLFGILKELYTSDEAELIIKMPFSLSSAEKISQTAKIDLAKAKKLLTELCHKGLIFDIWNGRDFLYAINPMIVGIFEFTMMRTDNNVDFKKLSHLFHEYMFGTDEFIKANIGKNKQVPVMRTIPYPETILSNEFVEIYDYEKASAIIDQNSEFAVGICSCRHKQEHIGIRECSTPLETCTSFGTASQYLVRNNLARKSSKSEMKEILDRSQETGLTITADNVKNNVGFICYCCGCCCSLMLSIKKYGSPNVLKSSDYIALVNSESCIGCGLCAKACPIDAIKMVEKSSRSEKKIFYAKVNEKICLGCGVCSLKCSKKALKLNSRKQRVLLPEDTFERIILQSLERNNLHNLFIDNPNNLGQKFMHGLLGGFFKLTPVQKTLMSERLRSKFLEKVRAGND